tara:strand:+ start:35 stop:553 length:519 start_codon:yes stop_codon:yes gene_type:complete
MLSGLVLKQFRTYLKSQVGNGRSVEGGKTKGRLLTRVSFRYLSGERSVVLLEIDFDADNQDNILRTVKKLSDLMRERNIVLSQPKELICGGKIDDNRKAGTQPGAFSDVWSMWTDEKDYEIFYLNFKNFLNKSIMIKRKDDFIKPIIIPLINKELLIRYLILVRNSTLYVSQ